MYTILKYTILHLSIVYYIHIHIGSYTVKNNGTLLSFKMWNTLKNVKYH